MKKRLLKIVNNIWYMSRTLVFFGVTLAVLFGMNNIVTSIYNGIEHYFIEKNRNYYEEALVSEIESYLKVVPEKYRAFVVRTCQKYDVPVLYYVKLVQAETGWRNVISRPNRNGTRDYGIAQINGSNIAFFDRIYFPDREFDVMNPFHNLEVSIKHLSALYSQLRNWRLSVASYNCGLGAVLKNRIPNSTQLYVQKII